MLLSLSYEKDKFSAVYIHNIPIDTEIKISRSVDDGIREVIIGDITITLFPTKE